MPIAVPDLDYTDQVLSSLITDEYAELATAEVDTIATFPEPWRSRLILLRIYIRACLEYASAADDPFTLKLAQYRAEYDAALPLATAAARAAAASTAPFMSMALERA